MLQAIENILTQPSNEIETKLSKYRELQLIMKSMQMELDSIKKDLVGSYFAHHDSYTNSSGMLLATYKASYPVTFNQGIFKSENPDLFEQYTEIKEQFRFIVK